MTNSLYISDECQGATCVLCETLGCWCKCHDDPANTEGDEHTRRYERIGKFARLDKVGEIELDNEAWQYNIIGVWKGVNGGYYLGTDSGCSCPTPWENTTKESLTGPLSAEQAIEEINNLLAYPRARREDKDDYAYGRYEGPDEFLVKDLIAKIK